MDGTKSAAVANVRRSSSDAAHQPSETRERVKIMQMTVYFSYILRYFSYLNISFYHHLHNHADTFSKSLMLCSLVLFALFLLKPGR